MAFVTHRQRVLNHDQFLDWTQGEALRRWTGRSTSNSAGCAACSVV